jgi:hypothetical protein
MSVGYQGVLLKKWLRSYNHLRFNSQENRAFSPLQQD